MRYTPLFLRILVDRFVSKSRFRQYREDMERLWADPELKETYGEELAEVLRTGEVRMITLPYTKEYSPKKVAVLQEDGFRYVMLNGKRLYYPRVWKKAEIKFYHNLLLTEMDARSPHCYLTDSFQVEENSVLVDLGGAEGFLALLNIEPVRHAYVFECDPLWEEPLKKTFAPWKDKVTIVPKYIGERITDTETTFDAFLKEENLSGEHLFVKCDIEGAEEAFLRGADEALSGEDMDLAVCLYHRKEAEQNIKEVMEKKGASYTVAPGYLFPAGFEKKLAFPCFRRGIMRCKIRNGGSKANSL